MTGVLDLQSSSTGFKSHSDRSQDLFLGHPKVKSPTMFEPNWLLSARPAGFLNLFLFYFFFILEFLFLVTVKPVLSGHRIKQTPSIKWTVAEVPNFISLICFKLSAGIPLKK